MRGMFASIWVLSYGLTLLLSTAIASAQQNRVQATVDPAVLIITGEQSVVSGRLDINARGTDVRRIRVRAQPALLGASAITIGFPLTGGKDWVEQDLGNDQSLQLTFEAKAAADDGFYKGDLEIFRADNGQLLTTLEVDIERIDSNFAITFASPLMKANGLEIETPNNSVDVVFTLKNGNDRSGRQLTVSAAAPEDGSEAASKVSFKPQSFRLRASQEEQVSLHYELEPNSKSSYGIIRVADASRPDLYKDLLVHVTRVRAPGWTVFWTFMLVLLGAFLSVMVRTVFPTGLAKRRFRNTLSEIERKIQRCNSASPLTKTTLLAQASGLRLVNGAIRWFSADRAEQLQVVEQGVKALDDRADLATKIAAVRDRVYNELDLPVSALISVEMLLKQGEELLLSNRIGAAGGKCEEADTARQAATSDANLEQIKRRLKDMAQRFKQLRAAQPPSAAATASAAQPLVTAEPALPAQPPAAAEAVPPAQPSASAEAAPDQPPAANANSGGPWPPLIVKLVNDVVASESQIDSLSINELVSLEHDAMIASNYLDEFLPAVDRYPDCGDFAESFLKLLQTDNGPALVRPLATVLGLGITPNKIFDEINTGRVHIVIDPQRPRVRQLLAFRLRFEDPQMEGVSAIRDLIEYGWDFGDGTEPVRTERGEHFYTKYYRKREKNIYKMTCQLSVPSSTKGHPGDLPAVKYDITVRQSPNHAPSLVEIASFGITALIAVLTAYAAQYTSVQAIDSFGAILTPFLFGFGLDQLRERTANPGR